MVKKEKKNKKFIRFKKNQPEKRRGKKNFQFGKKLTEKEKKKISYLSIKYFLSQRKNFFANIKLFPNQFLVV